MNAGGQRGTWTPNNTRRDVKKDMEATGFKYDWKKMDTAAAAQDRAPWRSVLCGLCSSGSGEA